MTGLLATAAGWITGTSAGRWVARVALAAGAVVLVLYLAYARGRAAREAEIAVQNLRAARNRLEVDREVGNMDRRARADAIRRWVRDGPGG